MLRVSLAVLVGLALVGCAGQPNSPTSSASSSSSQAQGSQNQAPGPAELAAYAGSHPYPASQIAKNDLRAAAIVNHDAGIIKVYNFTTKPIRDADIWINQAYVRHVNAIAAGASVTLEMSNLYNGVGQQFSARGEHVNVVQIDQDHDLQTLMGPAAQ